MNHTILEQIKGGGFLAGDLPMSASSTILYYDDDDDDDDDEYKPIILVNLDCGRPLQRCIHINHVCETYMKRIFSHTCCPRHSSFVKSRDILIKGRKHPVVSQQILQRC
jgi:hypothetical protein